MHEVLKRLHPLKHCLFVLEVGHTHTSTHTAPVPDEARGFNSSS